MLLVDCVWNVMTHAQKPDFVFRRNGRVHLNRRGRQFSRLLAAEVCGISGSNAGYNMFRGSVKSTGYPLHSPVYPSLTPPVRQRVPSHFNGTLTPKWRARCWLGPKCEVWNWVILRYISGFHSVIPERFKSSEVLRRLFWYTVTDV